MVARLRRLPSPALAISVIALVVAVGGGSFALAAIKAKGVKKIANTQITKRAPGLSVAHATTANTAAPIGLAGGALTGSYPNPLLQTNSVNTGNIANNAVTTGKIADNAVTTPKIADNSVTNSKIADSAVTSSKIADGEVRAADLASTTQTVSADKAIAANGNETVTVACPAGTKVLSGGGGASSFLVFNVESFQSGNGWLWVAHNSDGAAHTIFATAVCLNG